MRSPFPGMDPYLEHAALWPDVHNRLVTSIADALAPALRPRYYVAIEERVFTDEPADLALVGRADVAVISRSRSSDPADARPARRAGPAVVEVHLPVESRARETYLEVRGVESRTVVTVLELLSPTNKRGRGRDAYLGKREAVIDSLTHLIEVDLLRAGERMPMTGAPPDRDYAILVSRSWQRGAADLIPFDVRDAIPSFPVPLREGEAEPVVELQSLLGAVYERAAYDLRIDYRRPPEPPLRPEDEAWAEDLLRTRGHRP